MLLAMHKITQPDNQPVKSCYYLYWCHGTH